MLFLETEKQWMATDINTKAGILASCIQAVNSTSSRLPSTVTENAYAMYLNVQVELQAYYEVRFVYLIKSIKFQLMSTGF